MNSFKPHLLILAILVLIAGCLNITTAATSNTIQISSTGTIIYIAPLRHIDFETGDFNESINANWGGTIIQPGLVGNYAASFVAPPTADMGLWSWDPVNQYHQMYYDCLVKFTAGMSIPTWQMIFEINAPYPASGNEHIALLLGNRDGVTNNVFLQFYSNYDYRGYDLPYTWGLAPMGSGSDRVYELHSGVSMPAGQTVRIEVYVKTDLVNGIITVKMDGVEIINYQGRTQFDPEWNPDPPTPHYSDLISTVWGNYCDATLPVHEMILDEIYIGGSS
jgi:hypothetical protein